MTESCAHRWLITKWSQRNVGLRLRVRCSWCGRSQIWQPIDGYRAANWAHWQQKKPGSRA